MQALHLHGQISAIEFDAFADLVSLEELDVSRCHLRRISMDAFNNCRVLRIINLARNELSSLPPGLFDDLPVLEEVYLEHNKLQKLLPGLFVASRFPTLRLVHLVDNPWECSCAMSSWKAKITNQERIPAENRCIRDFATGQRISCRPRDYSLRYNREYTPRCANFKGRSVFYVLQKHLQCPPQKSEFVKTSSRQNGRRLPHWQKWKNAASQNTVLNAISRRQETIPLALLKAGGSHHFRWQTGLINSINENSLGQGRGPKASPPDYHYNKGVNAELSNVI